MSLPESTVQINLCDDLNRIKPVTITTPVVSLGKPQLLSSVSVVSVCRLCRRSVSCLPNRRHGLFDVGNDVIRILDTYRESDQIRSYTCSNQLLVRELAMGVAGRVQHRSAGIGYMGNNGTKLQRIHETDRLVTPSLQTECNDTARTLGQIFLPQCIVFVLF